MLGRTVSNENSPLPEARVAEALRRFHLDQQGVAPGEAHAWILADMVVFRCREGYTPTERELSKTTEGQKLIQSARRELRAITRRQSEDVVAGVLGVPIERSFFDIDIRTGEIVEVYILGKSVAG